MTVKTFQQEMDLFSLDNLPEGEKGDEIIIEGEEACKALLSRGDVKFDERFLLKTDAYVLKLTYSYNKIMSLSNSRTRILAHQVESTHQIVTALNHRFLLADEVGLGKTIEAGLVIKELKFRYNYKRILIVCPATLVNQWQSEMEKKFNEPFTILDRKVLNSYQNKYDKNPWKVADSIICSLDFIKNKDFAEDINRLRWDIVVFDECHRLRRDSKQSTLAYNAAEIISTKTKALLLLSATPFRGKLEELYYLISLLDKNILGPYNTFYRKYCIENENMSQLQNALAPVVIRRTKKDIGGFTDRLAKTVKFDLYPDERLLYDTMTTYVIEEFNRAMQSENRAVGFVMTVFQKLLDSSSYALLSALLNRLAKLQGLLKNYQDKGHEIRQIEKNYEDVLLDENDDLQSIVEIPAEVTISELKQEIKTITKIVSIAQGISTNKKGEKLKELIDTLFNNGIRKVIIFTQFRTTQDYLGDLLSDYKVILFHGSLTRDEKEDAIKDFKEDSEILICTEAGGEGRNLQFCFVMINYDLPWSPLKIEQRIGRIHRFGQKMDVYVYNFSTRDTVAERVLEVLTDKLRVFEKSIGTMDVLLGQVEDELDLNHLFMEMASGKKNKKIVESEIDERMKLAKNSYDKLSDLTVANKMDFNYDEYYRVTLKERQFSNKMIEDFVHHVYSIDEKIQQQMPIKKYKTGRCLLNPGAPPLERRYGTFDSSAALANEDLEFLAFGHPLVDSIVDYAQSKDFGGYIGVRGLEYDSNMLALVFNYAITYFSVSETREFEPVIVSLDRDADETVLSDIERELAIQCQNIPVELSDYTVALDMIAENSETYFQHARTRIIEKVDKRITAIAEGLDFQIDPELEKIQRSYKNKISELQQKLEIQEGRVKWYGEDLKGAITRTKNSIHKAEVEMNQQITKYRNYLGVRYSIEMINAGILVLKKV